MIKQLSIFVENKPGRVHAVMETLASANINARALNVADDGDLGIIRLIVDDAQKAESEFRNKSFTVKITDVIAFSIPDKAGALRDVMRTLGEQNINIKYLYSVTTDKSDKASILIRVADKELEKAVAILKESGVKLLTIEDLA